MTYEPRDAFRVWDNKNESYCADCQFYFDSSGVLYRKNVNNPESRERYLVERCTGQQDANNIYIYENDILRVDPSLFIKETIYMEVVWCQQKNMWFMQNSNYMWALSNCNKRKYTIAGNTHYLSIK